MSDGMKTVAAFFVGKAMAGSDDGSGRVALANDAAFRSERTASMAVTEREIERIYREAAEKQAQGWRQYAARLRVNLDARKMSEATLLAELKEANVSHPLATEEGFEAVFDKVLAVQYGELDNDAEPFDDLEVERMQQSVEQGRQAVK